ncbi:hypothetical protein [Ornithinimicrobium kibberense]|uniref:hypothetical protein n=1 Tax=Ornithinimicrobium kibberense TaxID=282060 RepID=UPI00361904C0
MAELGDGLVEPVGRAGLVAAPVDRHRADRHLAEGGHDLVVGPADGDHALGVGGDLGAAEGVVDGDREGAGVLAAGSRSVVGGRGALALPGVVRAARGVPALRVGGRTGGAGGQGKQGGGGQGGRAEDGGTSGHRGLLGLGPRGVRNADGSEVRMSLPNYANTDGRVWRGAARALGVPLRRARQSRPASCQSSPSTASRPRASVTSSSAAARSMPLTLR